MITNSTTVYAELNGATQYFYRSNADFPEASIVGDMTIQLWIKPVNVSGNKQLVTKSKGVTDDRSYITQLSGDEIRVRISSDGLLGTFSSETTTGMNIQAGVWTHVAMVYDASPGTVDCYKSGSFVEQQTGHPNSIANKAAFFAVGFNDTGGAVFFEGGMDGVAIFDDKRTAGEIAASAADREEDLSGAGNIIAQWQFNDAAAATAIDNSQGDAGRDLTPYDGGDTTFSGMRSATLSTGFIAKLQAKANNPRVRFVFDGDDTLDSQVLGVTQIHRDTRLSTGTTKVTVSNADQAWNIFLSDPTNMHRTASVSLYWLGDTEYMPLMTGTVERVEYRDPDINIFIRDRMSAMLGFPLGSGQAVQDYYTTGAWNAADLVWEILTDVGGLDATANSTNTDIDYDRWVEWKSFLSGRASSIKARFTGHSIQTALLNIATLTVSWIWVNNEGKFSFAPNDLPTTALTESDFLKMDVDESTDAIINRYEVYYGFDVDNGNFLVTPEVQENADSRTDYGAHDFTVEDRIVWHTNSASASPAATRAIALKKDPILLAIITSPFYHYRLQITDNLTLTEAHKGLVAEGARINELDIDISNATIVHKAFFRQS